MKVKKLLKKLEKAGLCDHPERAAIIVEGRRWHGLDMAKLALNRKARGFVIDENGYVEIYTEEKRGKRGA